MTKWILDIKDLDNKELEERIRNAIRRAMDTLFDPPQPREPLDLVPYSDFKETYDELLRIREALTVWRAEAQVSQDGALERTRVTKKVHVAHPYFTEAVIARIDAILAPDADTKETTT